ncbi:MAG TPA: periplasmic heavy metal sensor [Candidatus Acidoferrum sp.]|nr:periplasmic heavy metal sensor [Candidatus Acidoferrum sp.]
MNRSLVIVLAALVLGVALFGGSYFAGQRACRMTLANPADDLVWLRTEFHLSDAEMTRIRELHEGYRPRCAEMCARIAAKKAELEAALNGATNVSPEAAQKLAEVAALRAQCQAQMLQHFTEVSRTMSPEQGRRYLAEMQRLTLGFHEQTEQSMSGTAGHEHHHQ